MRYNITNEEAIQELNVLKQNVLKGYIKWETPYDCQEVIDMAIKAVERQIPRKFKMINGYIPVCPVCGEEIWDMDWCNSCGQRLDDEEE